MLSRVRAVPLLVGNCRTLHPSLRLHAVTVSMPTPPDTTVQTDPNITEGPRKRRPTERVTENGDPLAKKARIAAAHRNRKSAKVKTVTQRAIEDDHDSPPPPPRPCPQPIRANRLPEATESSDDALSRVGTVDSIPAKSISSDSDEEPEVEDDITEMSMSSIHLTVAR